ncbi:MAG: cation:proton antiporter [Gemmatales bacterium]|nr:cation:proton antiporter [Gemmatales bacterium]MDW8175748.1 cation:proton antiporter [Gemmatales bacterium]
MVALMLLTLEQISAGDMCSWSLEDLVQSLRRVHVEEMLLPVLVQLIVIILVARFFATLARRIYQPGVVGEIIAGLVLGPSVFGALFPQIFHALFHPGLPHVPHALADHLLTSIFSTLSQLGLIFLLFLVGLEFDFGHLRWHGKAAFFTSVAGIALPFVLGLGLAEWMYPYVPGLPKLGFALFLATALSITALPILGRIMMELNITRTRLGTITISAAAVDDAGGWILLAAVAGITRAEFELWRIVLMVVETVGFALGLLVLGRPIVRWFASRLAERPDGDITINELAVLLAVVLLCATATNLIGIFAIFGAFLFGAICSREVVIRDALRRRMLDFLTAFFLPIFFTYTGLRTNVGTLDSWTLWGFCGLVCLAAIAGKLGGCTLAARLGGFHWREAFCIGTMMNTRALMALVVINVGRDLGVISDSVFCMLVLMAVLTTLMTTPLLLLVMRSTELEPYIRASGFLAPLGKNRPH